VGLPEEAPALTPASPDAVTRRRRGLPGCSGKIRPVLAGAGAFLMTFGLLLRFYAAPRLIAAPVSIYSTVTLADPHASYFDPSTLTARPNVTLTLDETIRGDAAASTGTIAVWDLLAVLEDRKRHVRLNVAFQRSAFNRRTGQLTNCCGSSVNDDTRVRQDGIVAVKWPIGTQKTTYQVYDIDTERAWPAAYSGTAQTQGLLTYRFTQRVPPTVVQQLPGVPTSLLGLPGASHDVVANRTLRATNTFWVDPMTGVPVDAEERILSVLQGPGGQGRLVVVNADLKMTPASQRSLATLARQDTVAITTLRQTGPLGGLLLGFLLVLAGTVPFPGLPWQARPNSVSRDRRSRRAAEVRNLATGEHPGPVRPGSRDRLSGRAAACAAAQSAARLRCSVRCWPRKSPAGTAPRWPPAAPGRRSPPARPSCSKPSARPPSKPAGTSPGSASSSSAY
jgi:hypothetical protein